MSVRAYRVRKIEFDEPETFNLWHDELIYDLIVANNLDKLNQDGCGLLEVSNEEIGEAIQRLENDKRLEFTKKKETLGKLKTMLHHTKANEGNAMYYCF